jgi:hypothetical protein
MIEYTNNPNRLARVLNREIVARVLLGFNDRRKIET